MDGIWHARNNTEGKRPRGSVISGPHLGAVHCVLVQQQYPNALKRGRHSSGLGGQGFALQELIKTKTPRRVGPRPWRTLIYKLAPRREPHVDWTATHDDMPCRPRSSSSSSVVFRHRAVQDGTRGKVGTRTALRGMRGEKGRTSDRWRVSSRGAWFLLPPTFCRRSMHIRNTDLSTFPIEG